MSILSEQQTCYDCPKPVQNPQMTLQDDDLEDEMLDVDLISSQTLIPPSQAPDEIILTEGNIKVLEFINGVFGGIISSLATAPSRQIHPEIVLKQVKSLEYLPQAMNDRGSPENRHGICSVQPRIETRFVTYSWPGKTPEKTRRFGESRFKTRIGSQLLYMPDLFLVDCLHTFEPLLASFEGHGFEVWRPVHPRRRGNSPRTHADND